MPRSKTVSDDQIRDALKDAGEPVTAGSLGLVGVNAARLKCVEGVVATGTQKTGLRGRPAVLFALA